MNISVKNFLFSSFFLAVANLASPWSHALAAPTAMANSCQGLCGAAGPQGDCWCDEGCSGFGDCCSDYQAECVDVRECENRWDCGEGQFCDFGSDNLCGEGGSGVCKPRPEDCAPGWSPVCGCNGNTYRSWCSAHEDGVSIAYDGHCPPKLCTDFEANACGKDELCYVANAEHSCGFSSDVIGVCWPRPVKCSEIYEPVCGCDGEEFLNPCEAESNGVPVAYKGRCQENGGLVGSRCGGEEGLQCKQGLFCKADEEGSCWENNKAGTCIRKAKCPPIPDPVCGCDGRSYYNSCAADNARVAIASKGECPEPDKAQRCDGPYSPNRCAPGQYCEYAQGDTCGRGRAPAQCVLATQKCPGLNEPVCGCDGQTYSSSCVAHRRGVSVLKDGPC